MLTSLFDLSRKKSRSLTERELDMTIFDHVGVFWESLNADQAFRLLLHYISS